jgi:23S rRNA pseudouridine2605 synthase
MSKASEHTGTPGDRIAKVIARAGMASRREAEAWIAAGRVAVNGSVITSPAHNVSARDEVTIDGAPLPAKERTRLFLYHKPRGLMTTHADPEGRPTIFHRLPSGLPRLISVGRLDFNTEGLLLLTNDGALARVLELPATGWLRRYRVRAHGTVTQAQLEALRDGVTLSGIHYGAIEAALERTQGSNLWLSFAIREGKNREVRNVLSHLGLTVTRLIRVSFGPFQLTELAEGAVEEVRTRTLREQLGVKLAALAGADFSAPAAAAPPPDRNPPRPAAAAQKPAAGAWRAPNAERPPKPQRQTYRGTRRDEPSSGRPGAAAAPPERERPRPKSGGQKSAAHTWRTPDAERPQKPQRRKYHGARRDESTRKQPIGNAHADTLTDRKGRRVPIERHGKPPPAKETREDRTERQPAKQRHRRAFDRASGARPHRPREPGPPRGRR